MNHPREAGEQNEAERHARAHNASASAMLMALITLAAGTILQLTQGIQPLRFQIARLCLMGLALAGFCYFFATRRHPRRPVGVAFCVGMLIAVFVVQSLSAVSWTELGRPWEAYSVPKLVLVCMALILPLSLSVSLAISATFALGAVVIFVYQSGLGLGPRLPPLEPLATIISGGAGVILLLRREHRRRLVRDYLRLESASASLRIVAEEFHSIAAQLTGALGDLTARLGLLQPTAENETALLRSVQNGMERLKGVQMRLTDLTGDAPVDAKTEKPAVASTAPPSAAERQLYARDAQNGATAVAASIAFVCLAWLLGKPQLATGLVRVEFAAGAVIASVAIAELLRTRRDPREARGLFLILLCFVLALALIVPGQTRWTELGRPFEPHLGTKILMILVPLTLPRFFWLGFTIEVIAGAYTLIVWQALHLGALRDRVPLNEPWMTLLYAGIGVALMAFGEQRRLALVRRLHAEAELAALARRAAMLRALRDQFNSPLQAITIGVGLLRARHPDQEALHGPLAHAVARLKAISAALPTIDAKELQASSGLSFDGARELRRFPDR